MTESGKMICTKLTFIGEIVWGGAQLQFAIFPTQLHCNDFSHQDAMMQWCKRARANSCIKASSKFACWRCQYTSLPGPNITFTHLPSHNWLNPDPTLAEDFFGSMVLHLRFSLGEDFVADQHRGVPTVQKSDSSASGVANCIQKYCKAKDIQ